MDRRQVLTQCITVPVVAAAECIGNSEPTIQLAGIRVANFIDEPITVDVVVQKDGSTVQTEDIEVQAAEDGSGTTFEQSPIECTWSDVDAEYVIEARLNDGE